MAILVNLLRRYCGRVPSSTRDATGDHCPTHGDFKVADTVFGEDNAKDLARARTDEGRKRAKARGVRFGRPSKLDAHQRQEALQRLANGETLVAVARTYGVDATTIGRLQ